VYQKSCYACCVDFWDNFRADRPGPKYLAICDALADAIADGRLSPGRRLPSHRMLARKLKVAVGTVSRAYEEALERGLINGEVGRGSFVSHHPAHALRVVSESRIPAGCLDLYQNFPVAVGEVEDHAWARALSGLRRGQELTAMGRRSWSEVSERNRSAGAAWIRRTGLEPVRQNIFDCPGVQSALCAIFAAAASPGDTVLTASLSHPGIKLLADQYGMKVHGLPMDEYGIDVEALEAACATEAPKLLYCAPTLHSPTTFTMPVERREAIADVARRHDVFVVEDEAAGFLLDEPLRPIAAFAPDHVVFVGDVWMALSLSLRTTFVQCPERLREAMASAVATTSGITPPLIAEIAAIWIESDIADGLIAARVGKLRERNAMAQEILARRRLHSQPYGHHMWLELPEPWRSDLFILRAEQLGVAVSGPEFVVGHARTPEAVRVCIGNAPGPEELRHALTQLDRLIDAPESRARPAV
jgi:DNA-binding transcriptional MocR family regulator